MKKRYKILSGVVIVLAAVLAVVGYLMSRDAACPSAPLLAAEAQRMKGIVYRCYGASDVLKYEDVQKPAIDDGELLVKVHAASVNPSDWHFMRGKPYVLRIQSGFGAPKSQSLGFDFAGTVEAVGKNVTHFKVGDEIFGFGNGAFAEYVKVREEWAVTHKAANITFEQAASVPIAAVTALQALRDKARVHPGQKVLINGASGGVGTFAVQIAKSMGAEVTGVCSTRNVEMVRALGADHVVDYTKENFTDGQTKYAVILDNVGNFPLLAYRRVMEADGVLVLVGGSKEGNWIGPLMRPLKALLLSPFLSQRFTPFLARLNQKDLVAMNDLVGEGKVTPVIDRRYPLRAAAAAVAYVEEGRARGKVVITME